MDTQLLSIIFLIGYVMSVAGFYFKGYENGKKKMLSDLIDKKVISTDIYVKFLKLLEK